MSVAQGINKTLAFKVQAGLGTPASGSGGQLLRRETSTFNIQKDTYSNNEIASHQQHTGDIHGIRRTNGALSGVLSPSTYEAFQAALLRKAWAAVSAITGLTLTIAADGSAWTVTRSTGDFLTGGIKVGHTVRLSGANLDPANVGVNLVVTDVTATVLTAIVPNGAALVAESSKAASTVTVVGKTTYVPTSGHTNLYYTVEEWFADIVRSHVYQDVQPASMEIGIPATGNVTCNFNFLGLGKKAPTGAQVLTTPTAETSTSVVSSVSGAVVIGGTRQGVITSAQINVDGGVTGGEAVIGSNYLPDTQKGRIRVSGTFSALFENDNLAQVFDDETVTSLIFMLADDNTPGADFMVVTLPEVKLFSADADDGEKQIVRTYNFTAQICSTGGANLANHKTIIQLQDSTLS